MSRQSDRIKIVDVTFSVDAGNAYANNDLVADTQVLSNAFFDIDQAGWVESIAVIDDDDNTAIPLTFFFLSDSGSLGSENSAPAPTDAVADTILGYVTVAAADFYDLTNSKVASKNNIGLPVKPKSGTRNLYVAVAVGTGTPTYTASGLKARIAIRS